MDEVIRPAAAGDVAGIVAVLRSLAEEEGRDPPAAESLADLVGRCLDSPHHEAWVAALGEETVGYIVVHWVPFPLMGGLEGYISDLVVHGARRGARVGSRLLLEVEHRARTLGCARLMLNNRTASEAYRREFYPKRGFRRRDDFANFVKLLP